MAKLAGLNDIGLDADVFLNYITINNAMSYKKIQEYIKSNKSLLSDFSFKFNNLIYKVELKDLGFQIACFKFRGRKPLKKHFVGFGEIGRAHV